MEDEQNSAIADFYYNISRQSCQDEWRQMNAKTHEKKMEGVTTSTTFRTGDKELVKENEEEVR